MHHKYDGNLCVVVYVVANFLDEVGTLLLAMKSAVVCFDVIGNRCLLYIILHIMI